MGMRYDDIILYGQSYPSNKKIRSVVITRCHSYHASTNTHVPQYHRNHINCSSGSGGSYESHYTHSQWYEFACCST